jgi:hypothetical protein
LRMKPTTLNHKNEKHLGPVSLPALGIMLASGDRAGMRTPRLGIDVPRKLRSPHRFWFW